MDKRQQTGFTLYELMITLMVIAIILSFGIPNMRAFTLNSRMTGTANDLHAAFQMARSEAAHAKTNVTICASADPMGAALFSYYTSGELKMEGGSIAEGIGQVRITKNLDFGLPSPAPSG